MRLTGVGGSTVPLLWVTRAAEAVEWYERAFDAEVLMRVGEGDDIVARLAVGQARFWVSAAEPGGPRYGPETIEGSTGRTLLIVDDPRAAHARALENGAAELAEVAEEHGWRVGRIRDPYGHEWEIGRHSGQ